MKIVTIIFFAFSINVIFSNNSFSQSQANAEVDYSSLEIARKYQMDKNYLFTYKHLLIFRYTNQRRLEKSENRDTLKSLDKKIAEFERVLQDQFAEKTIVTDSASFRGYTKSKGDLSTFTPKGHETNTMQLIDPEEFILK